VLAVRIDIGSATVLSAVAAAPDKLVEASTMVDTLLAPFEMLGDAVAIGSSDARDVLGMTVALQRLVRTEDEPIGDWPVLLMRLEALCADDDSACSLTECRLEGGYPLVRIAACQRDVQAYLAERDDLFLTSRTVSVSEMATTLAHELNQPLGTLSNLLGGLKIRHDRGNLPPDVLSGAITDARDQTRFAQNVIARIRDFTASRRPEPRTLDLVDLVERSAALLDWLLRSAGTQVLIRRTTTSVRVHGDRTMLQQVLINLLRNAVEAMRDRAVMTRRIDVVIGCNGERATIAIIDRGSGIAGSEAMLFVPFASGKPDGMGVGLNICRSFLELHQGRLWLTGNDEGGCTSHIELPLQMNEGRDG